MYPQARESLAGRNGLTLHELVFVGIENAVRYRLSVHAQEEIERRRIPVALLEAVLENPDQVVAERGALKAYQSRCDIGGKMYLVRLIVHDAVDPAVVVSAYRTTKIEKYWGKP